MELYSEATDTESDAVVVTDTIIFDRINSLIEKLDQVISSTQEMSQNLTRTNLNSDTENPEDNNFAAMTDKTGSEDSSESEYLSSSSNGFTVNSSTSRVVKANAISSLKCDPVRVVNSPDNSSKKLASPRVVKPHDHGGIPKNLPKKSRPTPMVKSKSDIPFSGASEKQVSLSVSKKIPTDRSSTQNIKNNVKFSSNVSSGLSSPGLASQTTGEKLLDVMSHEMSHELSHELSDIANVLSISKNPNLLEMSEDEAMAFLSDGHKTMASLLVNKQLQIETAGGLWKMRGPKAALDYVVSLGRQDVLVDLLDILSRNQKVWNLDVCQSVLPTLSGMLSSPTEKCMLVGCSALKTILSNFGGIIKTNIEKTPDPKDIPGGERYAKSLDCFKGIRNLCPLIYNRRKLTGDVGHRIREIEFILLDLD